jgi:hypothetical protein
MRKQKPCLTVLRLFQPVNDPSYPAVIENAEEALQAYSYTPASEPTLTNPVEVQDAIRGLKVGKTPGSNSLPNRPLKYLRSGLYAYSWRYLTRRFSHSTSHQYGNTSA